MNKMVTDYLKGNLGVITPLLSIMCIASALFTYSGASVEAVTFDQKAKATVFAIASGAFIYMFWYGVINLVPPLRESGKRLFANAIVMFGIIVIVWLSGVLNVAGMAGLDALEGHLNVYVSTLQKTVDEKFERALLIKEIIADLRLEQNRYEQAAKAELDEGSYSGTIGSGSVFFALQAIQNRIGALSLEAEKYLENSRKINAQSLKRLDKLGKIISSDKPLVFRMRDLNKESAALRSELAELNIKNFSGSVTRTLAALPRSIEVISVFSNNAQVAARQKQALARVRKDVEKTIELLTLVMDKIESLPPVELEPFERITAVRAVLLYWYNYIPYFAGGIGLDIAPLAVVYLLQNAILSKTASQIKRAQVLGMTLEEQAQLKIGEEYYRRLGLDIKEMKGFNDDLLGKSDEIDLNEPGDE